MRVAVVGAGLAGLLAARSLVAKGHDVVVLEKGDRPGGRLATRRLELTQQGSGQGPVATFDVGAQFFTVRSEAFAALVAGWQRADLVREWCRGFVPPGDGFPRYAVAGGMAALAEHLAAGLHVRDRTMVFAIRRVATGWSVGLDDGAAVAADALVVTCPLPQTAALLITAEVTLPEALRRVDYDRTIALLVALDAPCAVPPPGGVQSPDATLSFVADNQAKGVSLAPAVTLHAGADWSAAHWDDPAAGLTVALLEAGSPWLGDGRVVATELKRWRFATPQATWARPCHVVEDADVPLVLAGDAFAGPRVEGAALSGLAAADAITS
jgi:predicted NAD/FAD-dependent oxidoreductase